MRRTLVALAVVLLLVPAAPAPVGAGGDKAPEAQTVRSVPGVAAVFYPSVAGLSPRLGGPHFCTASVVHSRRRDLLVTAAHCVFGIGAGIEVAPLLHDDVLPRGVWSVTKIYVHPAWVRSFDPRHDIAFLRVASRGGRRLEDVVPGRRLGAPRAARNVRVTGYPMGSGGRPVTCAAPLIEVDGYPGLRCRGFEAGTSGGPWVQRGRVVGVVGGLEQGGCAPDLEYSAPFGPDVRSLFRRAVADGPGDLVPIGFAANAC